MKKTLLGLLFAAVLVSFMMMPSLQGVRDLSDDQIKFSPDDTMKDLQVKIQKIREQIRQEGQTYEVGINPAMQYSLDQLCGFNPELAPTASESPVVEETTEVATPAAGYIGKCSPIKNQGSCGSCWAFATVGAVEGTYCQLKGNCYYSFSDQYVLDCNCSGYSCSGGWFSFDTFYNCPSPGGVPLAANYPAYNAVKYSCRTYSGSLYKINGYTQICTGLCATASIKTAIQNYGAVAVAVYCDTAFQAYTSGCFAGTRLKSPNHAIVLCGWDDTTPCSTGGWKLKNSWGTGWGESGFMWIKYGSQYVGYSATYANSVP